MRRAVAAAFAAAALAIGVPGVFGPGALWSWVTGAPASRSAVSSPACAEDDPCWEWRTMGDRQRGVCIDDVDWLEHADPAAPYDVGRRTYTAGGRGCEALADNQRFVCWVEPSATPEGFEVIWYPHLADVEPGNAGFEVTCA